MANTYHERGETVDGFSVREHPLYYTWACMKARCQDSNSPAYKNYGGRGLTVCDRWQHFKNFAEDMSPKPQSSLTIERVDNSKGYSPDNCIWETRSNQCVNRRKFSNNTSGHTGVGKTKNGWYARFDYSKIRYALGIHASYEEACSIRDAFVELFFSDRELALLMAADFKTKARTNSSTGVRGISPHADGGFTCRVTVNGTRVYLGYFKTIEEATDARLAFLEKEAR